MRPRSNSVDGSLKVIAMNKQSPAWKMMEASRRDALARVLTSWLGRCEVLQQQQGLCVWTLGFNSCKQLGEQLAALEAQKEQCVAAEQYRKVAELQQKIDALALPQGQTNGQLESAQVTDKLLDF